MCIFTSSVIGPDVTTLLACMCIFISESKRQHLLWARESITDANPGTDYKDICWQDGRRIVELKTLAEQLSACDGCDIPLNLMNIEQERLHGFTFLSNSFKCSEHFFRRRISPSFKNGIYDYSAWSRCFQFFTQSAFYDVDATLKIHMHASNVVTSGPITLDVTSFSILSP
jgi:hypothetical protein